MQAFAKVWDPFLSLITLKQMTVWKLSYTLQESLEQLLETLPGGALPYMGYIGMCRCEGYGFQAVYSRIGYINQSVWV